MSSLYLVRHAQASFFAQDYDQLSEIGKQQASLLGSYWVENRVEFDHVIVGPRKRHQHTGEIVGRHLREAGLSWPEPEVRSALDEHGVDVLLMKQLDQLSFNTSDVNSQIQPLLKSYAEANSMSEKERRFQQLFEAVAYIWIDADTEVSGVESWIDFRRRVTDEISRIRSDAGRGKRIAVFTSVGPIAVTLLQALNTSEEAALELGWRIRNCSLTRFVFREDRFTLDGFNLLPHLNETMLTYR